MWKRFLTKIKSKSLIIIKLKLIFLHKSTIKGVSKKPIENAYQFNFRKKQLIRKFALWKTLWKVFK